VANIVDSRRPIQNEIFQGRTAAIVIECAFRSQQLDFTDDEISLG